jgi:hypothetical protein
MMNVQYLNTDAEPESQTEPTPTVNAFGQDGVNL